MFLLALLQLIAWISIYKSSNSRPVSGEQQSLFAWCWWYSIDPSSGPELMASLSLLALATSALPVDRRAPGYKIVLIAPVIMLFLEVPAHSYLVAQLPGVWGSMLNFREDRQYPREATPLIFLDFSVWIILLARLLLPG